jgi:hypothetical protein
MLAIKLLLFLLFLGDLTKAKNTPLPGEVPPPADLDLDRVGLDAGPKAALMGGARPSGPGHIDSEGLAVSFFFVFLLYWFGVTDICFFGFLFRELHGYTKWVDGASPCSLHGDRGLIVTSIFCSMFLSYVAYV